MKYVIRKYFELHISFWHMERLLKLQRYSDGLLSTSVLLHLLADYNSPYDKINEWVKQGVLVQLRRGLYVLSEELGLTKV